MYAFKRIKKKVVLHSERYFITILFFSDQLQSLMPILPLDSGRYGSKEIERYLMIIAN